MRVDWKDYIVSTPDVIRGKPRIKGTRIPVSLILGYFAAGNTAEEIINEIVNKKRGITPSTALRLAKFFGMSEDFWINLQLRWDLYKTRSKEYNALKAIKPASLQHASAQL